MEYHKGIYKFWMIPDSHRDPIKIGISKIQYAEWKDDCNTYGYNRYKSVPFN